ncbi:MAG TPA: chorismate synthase, partial [Candidatus Aminicenantes bacterium]|nr:chorismate synthase [Candidatus Aminicenantes bacterium]
MNSFGRLFRIEIFGESHGREAGVIVDGCPAGVPLAAEDFLADLGRRKPGAPGTTARREPDAPLVRSGVHNGLTTGAPILVAFENTDVRSEDYAGFRDLPRPGHADLVARRKFGGFHDPRGGGHFSGRITVGLVAAGVVAKKLIRPAAVECALLEAGGSPDIDDAVRAAGEAGDSVGGLLECRVRELPAGLGEPFFDSVESLIGHAVFAIPGVKGVEFGSGFACTRMRGSQANDALLDAGGATET